MTSNFLSLTWFTALIMPVLEHAYIVRYNLNFTILGMCLVLLGTAIRALGIKTLGKYFSREVETWENHTIPGHNHLLYMENKGGRRIP